MKDLEMERLSCIYQGNHMHTYKREIEGDLTQTEKEKAT